MLVQHDLPRRAAAEQHPAGGGSSSADSCTLQNFHLDSDATSRERSTAAAAPWTPPARTGSPTASGASTSSPASGPPAAAARSRTAALTAIWADGCNLNNVSLTGTVGNNLTATNNFVRGTGDDGMAINSVDYNGSTDSTRAMSHITMTHNTIIAPWGGKGIGIYGGSGHVVEYNYISDTARYIGLGVGPVRRQRQRPPLGHGHRQRRRPVRRQRATSRVSRRCTSATAATARTSASSATSPSPSNTVINSLYDGIGFSTSTGTLLQNNTITSPVAQRDRDLAAVLPGADRLRHDHRQHRDRAGRRAGRRTCNNSGGFTATLSGNSWQGGGPPEAPVRRDGGGGPGHRAGRELRHRRPGRRVQRHLGQRQRQRLPADGVDLETTSDTGGG